jgi:hypothetical protein
VNNLQNMTDESLLAYYESIRRQVAADRQLGARYRLVGGTVKQYAEHLGQEIRRRQLALKPIEWSCCSLVSAKLTDLSCTGNFS